MKMHKFVTFAKNKKNKKNEDKHESDKKFIKSEIISIIQKIERC